MYSTRHPHWVPALVPMVGLNHRSGTMARRRAVAAAIRAEILGCDSMGAHPTIYQRSGVAAVRHVCRVACGLNSQVGGEHQIAGPVAWAFHHPPLALDGQDVLAAAAATAKRAPRRVRIETDLGRHPASVRSVAVEPVREEPAVWRDGRFC